MRLRLILAICLLAVIAVGAWLVWQVRPASVKAHLVAALNERFDAQVEVDDVTISVFPRPAITGTGLTLRFREWPDGPPLLAVKSFSASAGLRGLIGPRVHLGTVHLDGFDIHVPPGGLKPAAKSLDTPDNGRRRSEPKASIVIDEIVVRDARLEIATRKPNKLPRVFEIHDLVMLGFGLPEGAKFQSGVTNAIPRGRVETSGVFGPWQTEDPSLTPIRGEYVFKNANLDDIKGINGTLSSVGQYRGTLERIEVDGQTETPDFSIDLANQPVPLSTRFKAIVDGTNGDTWLDRVDARLGESNILASGAVVRERDVKGRHIALDIQIRDARVEDVMRLVVKANRPPMTGRMALSTTFLLPAGEQDVIDRLALNGQFSLAQARFTNVDVQRRITSLSLRARGDENPEPEKDGSVVSNLRGKFSMHHAQLDFKQLNFSIPGAEVQLIGGYAMRPEQLDFKGELLVDATLADMTSGFKAFLARIAQPFFRRPGGGSKLPIKISGPRTKPEFGLDVGRVFKRG